MSEARLIILGAGPTGLGAAYRLTELGYANFHLYERADHVGGIAHSPRDERGFTWDQGVHVLYSHYEYFDRLFDKLLGSDYVEHQRENWVWRDGRFIPYPFQHNLRYLPKEEVVDCLAGLVEAGKACREERSFLDWVLATMGPGIAKLFMVPYNEKLWLCDLAEMSKDWTGERVPPVDVRRVIENVIFERDDVAWGPNNTFKYPLNGTGDLFERMAPDASALSTNTEALGVDARGRTLRLSNGRTDSYDVLISTLPLPELVRLLEGASHAVREAADRLSHNSVYVCGLGLDRPYDTTKYWVYFPEQEVSFYRLTYLGNFSPLLAPAGHFSLVTEAAYLPGTPLNSDRCLERATEDLIRTGILEEADRRRIVSTFYRTLPYAYPVPTLTRDRELQTLHTWLEEHSIFSRGRFGTWRYEIGNMDHSVMQGVEIVNRLLLNEEETVWRS